MINAIILAGEQKSKNWNQEGNKALFRINGKAMIEYVVEAIKNARNIDKVIVVGNKSELEICLGNKVDAIVNSNCSIMENLIAGVNYFGDMQHVVVLTSDIPMITSEAIDDFIEKALVESPDLCYPIIDKNENFKKYPEAERTYVKIKEGIFTGGNIFYTNPQIIEKGFALADELLKAKKNPLKMASLISPGFMVQLLFGTLTICKIEKKVSNILNIKAKAIISKFPEIGNDVDKPSDIIVATAYLSK